MSVIGIDFGTTQSSMAVPDPETGRVSLVRDAEGNEKTPSVVYFGDHETVVGTEAVNMIVDARGDEEIQARVIRSIKRQLLSPPRIALPGGRTVRPVEVAAEVFRKLKDDAEAADHGETLRRAIVTYPAVFDGEHASAIVEAATLAGFEEVELLAEPAAAAIAFEHEGGHVGHSVLVYDFGGGTFDAALIVRDDGDDRFHLALEPDGDPRCGGDDIDRALYDHFDEQAVAQTGRSITLRPDHVDPDFLMTCRRRKESLSKNPQVTFSTMLPGGVRFSSTIDRATFEKLISEQIERTIDITDRTAARAREAGYPVDTVLLVGGSSQIPLVQRRIAEALGLKTQTWGHRDVAVSLGAAHHALAVWGRRRPRPAFRDTREQYLRAVRLVWSDGRLEAGEIDRLRSLRAELSLSPAEAAEIEREVIGRTKEEFSADGQRPPEPADGTAVANLLRRADAHRLGRRLDEAQTAYEMAFDLDPSSAEAHAGRGQLRLARHQYAAALEDFERALELHPGLFTALVGRARVNTARYRVADSLADLDQAIRLDVLSSEAYEARGWAHSQAGDDELAVADFDRALSIDRASATALAGRGRAKLSLDQKREAGADIAAACEIDPDCVAALVGQAALSLADEVQPDGLVERIFVLEPDSPEAGLIRGVLELIRGRLGPAVDDFQRVLRINPDEVEARMLLALALIRRGDAAAALDVVEPALTLDPTRADLHALRGWAHVDLERATAAIDDLDRALAPGVKTLSAVGSEVVYRLRGKAKMKLGLHEPALSDLTRALDLDPTFTAAMIERSLTYLQTDHLEQAFADAQAAVAVESASEEYREFRAAALALLCYVRSAGTGVPPGMDGPTPRFSRVPQGVQRQDRNRHFLSAATFENGWRTEQLAAVHRMLNSTEGLVWLCRCARAGEVMRQVALVVTSERLIWCRQTLFGSPESGSVEYPDIAGVEKFADGFAVQRPGGGVIVRFGGIQGGVDLTDLGLSLSAADVGELVDDFAALHRRFSS